MTPTVLICVFVIYDFDATSVHSILTDGVCLSCSRYGIFAYMYPEQP